jgi:hypothetical protein
MAEPLKMAAIAYDNFELEFINTSLHLLESTLDAKKQHTKDNDSGDDTPLCKNRIVISTSKFRQKQQLCAPERGVGCCRCTLAQPYSNIASQLPMVFADNRNSRLQARDMQLWTQRRFQWSQPRFEVAPLIETFLKDRAAYLFRARGPDAALGLMEFQATLFEG